MTNTISSTNQRPLVIAMVVAALAIALDMTVDNAVVYTVALVLSIASLGVGIFGLANRNIREAPTGEVFGKALTARYVGKKTAMGLIGVAVLAVIVSVMKLVNPS